ncbi:interleukin-17 receptor A isoform X2 [Engystomops pustulosus]
MDLSWIRPFNWTPAAPASLEVMTKIGVSEKGDHVPVLHITWTVRADSSIRDLQGVEISVLDISLNRPLCVQFQFANTFPSQWDQNNRAWKFYFNNFEVGPGKEYEVSVQHLPRNREKSQENRLEQRVMTPDCSDKDMLLTETCCKLGFCWNYNISVEITESEVIVEFSPRSDAHKYGVEVFIERIMKRQSKTIDQVSSDRVQVNFSNFASFDPCWYNISVWPYMEPCNTDCVRKSYVPKCPTTTTVFTTPAPLDPFRVWPIAAILTIAAFTAVILFWRFQACIHQQDPEPKNPSPPPPTLASKKVWLVYSADHKLYVDVVIRLADFMRVDWGLDVVLDQLESHEIGVRGVMPWLGHQKEQIEKTNGTILILCSPGAQAKWRALQDRQKERVTLPEDASYMYGDLFTPALTLIFPDFQKAKPYDRYLVAYFNDLFTHEDIPSLFEICPCYPVVDKLKDLLFRIQRIEQNQPSVQYDVCLKEYPSYAYLLSAIEQCRAWQQQHLDWFGKECPPVGGQDEEDLEEEVGHECTRRIHPKIRQPETAISMVNPRIIEQAPVQIVNPSLVRGPTSVYVVPRLNEEPSPVTVLQPSLRTDALRASYMQEPLLVVDESFPLYNEMDLSAPGDQEVQSEDLVQAQLRFFSQSFGPDELFHGDESFPGSGDLLSVRRPLLQETDKPDAQFQDLMEVQRRLLFNSIWEGPAGDESIADCLPMPHHQDVWTNDLQEAQKRFLLQTIGDGQHLLPEMVCDAGPPLTEHHPLLENAGVPLPLCHPAMDVGGLYELNEVMGQTDNRNCHSEDLGYGTLNPNNLEEMKGE